MGHYKEEGQGVLAMWKQLPTSTGLKVTTTEFMQPMKAQNWVVKLDKSFLFIKRILTNCYRIITHRSIALHLDVPDALKMDCLAASEIYANAGSIYASG